MTKILFICHGNICRSPMAEFIMKDMVTRSGVKEHFHIESAATSTEELGNPVYRPAKAVLAEHGIDCKDKRARRIKPDDYDKFDYLIGMDSANITNMRRMFGGDPDSKIHKLLEFTGRGGDVADPWYTRDFERTWEDVYAGCEAFLRSIIEG